MGYIECNGYLVRRGKTVSECGFILPKDRKQYQKKKKEELKEKEDNLEILNRIKKLLSELTDGYQTFQKAEFLKNNLDVYSFSKIETMNKDELVQIISKLSKIKANRG